MTENEVVEMVDAVCWSRRRLSPARISFDNSPHARVTFGRGGTIHFPAIAYATRYHLLSGEYEHRLLVLHEVAHWLVGKDAGHKPDPFYTTLYELVAEHGMNVGHALRDEVLYKPRYAKKGYELYRARKNPAPQRGRARG